MKNKVLKKYLLFFLFSMSFHQANSQYENLQKQFSIIKENQNNFDALYTAAKILIDLKKNDAAIYFLNRAIEFKKNNKKINNDLAVLLLELGNHFFSEGKPVKAINIFKKIIELEQSYKYFHHNIGFTLAKHLGKHYEALEHYKKAIKAAPENAETKFCYATSCLATGNLKNGWKNYKARWKRKHNAPRSFPYPLEKEWTGENLFGKTILIRCEQGLGDTLHFIRYAELIKKQGATIIVETQKPLLKILYLCSYIDKLIKIGEKLPNFDYQIPLLDLPYVFETTIETIPQNIPYLFADKKLEKKWTNYDNLSSNKTLKVGICWHGDSAHGKSKFMPLKNFIPIMKMDGVKFYSLQKITGLDQLNNLNIKNLNIFDNLDTENGSFMDTAAIIKQLDLVITADTSIAHLAGGLGVKTWIVLPFPAEWRWLMYRNDSPWYPTVKLFRQKKPGNWSSVQKELIENLQLLSISKKSKTLYSSVNNNENNNNSKLASFFAQNENYSQALNLYEKLLKNNPNNPQLMFNKSFVLKKLHRYNEAIDLYQTIFSFATHNPKINLSASHAYLITGNYEKGFPLFEYRWFYPPYYNQKLKNNIQNINGKTILLKTEFGLGDTMQFIRYAKLLKEKGATIIVESQKPLVPLLSLCPYIDQVTTKYNIYSSADFTCQLMSLPFIFDTKLKTVPNDVPYLYSDKKLEKKWKHHIDKKSFNIGICWHADPHKNSNNKIVKKDGESKSIPLKLLAQLSELKNVKLYNLQKIDGLDQLKNLTEKHMVHSFGKNFDNESGSFMDSAAIIKQLDLVITIDTSVAHLAGGLNIPVWILLPHTADWRWLLNRTDSPWYPTMKLFRQPKAGDWKSVIDEIKKVLIYSFSHF